MKALLPLLLVIVMIGMSSLARANTVKVVAWNVFDLPEQVFNVQSAARMRRAVAAVQHSLGSLDDVDAVVLTELYVKSDRERVLADLARLGFTHSGRLISHDVRDLLSLSGMVVASRWPIEKTDGQIYRHVWHGFDTLTLKGILYLRLARTVDGKPSPINLFATHFYDGPRGEKVSARDSQAHVAAQFIGEHHVPKDEIIILAGDLNAPWTLDGPHLCHVVGAYPFAFAGELDHTFSFSQHVLSGDSRQSIKERIERARKNSSNVLGQSGKWIDYVVALAPGRLPTSSTLRAYDVRSEPYAFAADGDASMLTDVLSDHHLVLGTLQF